MKKEKKKSNKKILIIIAIVLLVLVGLIIIMQKFNNSTSLPFGKNQDSLMSSTERIYGNTQVNNMNKGILVEDDDYIYYSVKDYRDSYYIFKKSKQNDEVTELTSAQATYLNIYNNDIYYINESEHSIFKMNKDGNNRTRVMDNVKAMYIVNNYIYYIQGKSFHEELYRFNIETKKTEKITNTTISEFTINENYIYYINDDNKQLYRANLLGMNEECIFTDKVEHICIADNKIYVSNTTDGNAIYELSLDGKENKKVLAMDKSLTTNSYIIVNNKIGILEKKILTNHLCLYDMNGNAIKQISLKELYNNLGLYFPNSTHFGVYDNMVLIDTDYRRFSFEKVE